MHEIKLVKNYKMKIQKLLMIRLTKGNYNIFLFVFFVFDLKSFDQNYKFRKKDFMKMNCA
jgi:hypothetical protein